MEAACREQHRGMTSVAAEIRGDLLPDGIWLGGGGGWPVRGRVGLRVSEDRPPGFHRTEALEKT